MRVSTIILSLALAVGLAIAGPISDRDDSTHSLDPVEGVKAPQSDPVDPPSPADETGFTIIGEQGPTTAVSKRDDHNPLDERAIIHIVYLCQVSDCRRCWSYSLHLRPWICYATPPFRSLYIAGGNFPGVYVGPNCSHRTVFTQIFMQFIQYGLITFLARSSLPCPSF
jgi:hypothetical protein